MASKNGHVSLSAIDFLGLVKRRKVGRRLTWKKVGYEGVIYVRDLTAAQQQKVVEAAARPTRRDSITISPRWTCRR